MERYNKLVRDKVPELIRRNGRKPRTRILTDHDDWTRAALAKLVEEAEELRMAASTEERLNELADLHEVLDLVLRLTNIRRRDIVKARARKNRVKGRFKKGVFLIGVE